MQPRKLLSLVLSIVLLGALVPASALAQARKDSTPAAQPKRTHVDFGEAAALRARSAAAKRPAAGISAASLRRALTLDTFEPDDTTLTAKPVAWGVEETHSIDATTGRTYTRSDGTTYDGPDFDYHSFVATQYALYTFETSGTADTALELIDYDNGDVYVWNDDKDPAHGNFGSIITWTAPAEANGHTLYVVTEPANFTTGVGDYTFTATEDPETYIPGVVKRVWGADRFTTAEAVAKTAFPSMTYLDTSVYTRKHVTTVIIANGADAKAADPLAAAPLAGINHAPIMLVSGVSVPAATVRVINSIKAGNGGKANIIVIGGTGTVPLAVYNSLARLKGTGGTIQRVSGSDRYDLAGRIADRVRAWWLSTYHMEPPRVFVSNGENPAAFWDALAASPALYRTRCPLLLTKKSSVPAATHNRIASHWNTARTKVTVLNRAYVPSTLWPYLGTAQLWYWAWDTDRTWAAYEINYMAQAYWFVPSEKIAITNKLADSLTGGVGMGELGGGLLYTAPTKLSDAPFWQLYWNQSVIQNAYVLGGAGSITATPYNEVVYWVAPL